jgi:hypothetical protein
MKTRILFAIWIFFGNVTIGYCQSLYETRKEINATVDWIKTKLRNYGGVYKLKYTYSIDEQKFMKLSYENDKLAFIDEYNIKDMESISTVTNQSLIFNRRDLGYIGIRYQNGGEVPIRSGVLPTIVNCDVLEPGHTETLGERLVKAFRHIQALEFKKAEKF